MTLPCFHSVVDALVTGGWRGSPTSWPHCRVWHMFEDFLSKMHMTYSWHTLSWNYISIDMYSCIVIYVASYDMHCMCHGCIGFSFFLGHGDQPTMGFEKTAAKSPMWPGSPQEILRNLTSGGSKMDGSWGTSRGDTRCLGRSVTEKTSNGVSIVMGVPQ